VHCISFSRNDDLPWPGAGVCIYYWCWLHHLYQFSSFHRCSAGYHGHPQTLGGSCQKCDCSMQGSVHSDCDRTSGQCVCKPGATGLRCEECQPRHMLVESNCVCECFSPACLKLGEGRSGYSALLGQQDTAVFLHFLLCFIISSWFCYLLSADCSCSSCGVAFIPLAPSTARSFRLHGLAVLVFPLVEATVQEKKCHSGVVIGWHCYDQISLWLQLFFVVFPWLMLPVSASHGHLRISSQWLMVALGRKDDHDVEEVFPFCLCLL
jgi:hypothetical protein